MPYPEQFFIPREHPTKFCTKYLDEKVWQGEHSHG